MLAIIASIVIVFVVVFPALAELNRYISNSRRGGTLLDLSQTRGSQSASTSLTAWECASSLDLTASTSSC